MSTRSQYDSPVQDVQGNVYANVQATVYLAGTSNTATLYQTKAGGTTISNPIITDSNGIIQFWADPGSYDIAFHDLQSPARFSDRTITWEAVSGVTEGISWDQIDKPTGGITGTDIADNTIAGSKLVNDTVDGTKIAADAIGNNELADNAVAKANMQDNSVGTNELENSAVTLAKIAQAAQDTFAIPAGTILATGRSSAPTGYLICNGSAVSRETYSGLFAAIGTAFGVGDGGTTFNIPDLRGRVPAGVDGGTGRITSSNTLGAASGEGSHTLSASEMPGHTHSVTTANHTHGVVTTSHTHSVNTGNHTHSVNFAGHTHSVQTSDHTHNTTLPDHTHSFSLPTQNGAGWGFPAAPNLGGFSPSGSMGSAGGGIYGSSSAGGGTYTSSSAGGQNINTGSGGGQSLTSGSAGGESLTSSSAGGQSLTSGSAGGGGTHNNLQPYQIVNYMIKT